MKQCWKDLKSSLELIPKAIEEKLQRDEILTHVYQVTGFKGDDAKNIIQLLMRWHYYDQSNDTKRRLAKYGIKVGE